MCSTWTVAVRVAVRCMPKSLTEVICSVPDREAGEMKLRAPGRLKTISLVVVDADGDVSPTPVSLAAEQKTLL